MTRSLTSTTTTGYMSVMDLVIGAKYYIYLYDERRHEILVRYIGNSIVFVVSSDVLIIDSEHK